MLFTKNYDNAFEFVTLLHRTLLTQIQWKRHFGWCHNYVSTT